jgi:hypothetical protein
LVARDDPERWQIGLLLNEGSFAEVREPRSVPGAGAVDPLEALQISGLVAAALLPPSEDAAMVSSRVTALIT